MPAARRSAASPPRPPPSSPASSTPSTRLTSIWAITSIIINAEKIVLTGLKADQKLYRRYTGFPGGLREESFVKLLARRPEAIVEQAVKGMLPKSKLGRQMATKLKVYKGSQHPHLAQQPVADGVSRSNAPKAKFQGCCSGAKPLNQPGR